MASDNQPKRKAGGELYELLRDRFPTHRNATGGLHVANLGKSMGLAHETMYKAVRGDEKQGFAEGKLTQVVAVKLLQLSRELHPERPIYVTELTPFMVPFYEEYLDPLDLLA